MRSSWLSGPQRQRPLPGLVSLDSRIGILMKKAWELIDSISEHGQKDYALMTNFRDSLKMKVWDLTEKLEKIYQMYSHDSKTIQERLQGFTQKMAKTSHLEMEPRQVFQTVITVYKDLCVQSEVPTSQEQNYEDDECWFLLRGFHLNSFSPTTSHRGYCLSR